MRQALALAFLFVGALAACGTASPDPAGDAPGAASFEVGRLAIKNADPSVIRVGAS